MLAGLDDASPAKAHPLVIGQGAQHSTLAAVHLALQQRAGASGLQDEAVLGINPDIGIQSCDLMDHLTSVDVDPQEAALGAFRTQDFL